MKKIIRLTESDLHNIIKESVQKIIQEEQLNELDPRTYASYADGRRAQARVEKILGNDEKARDLYDKAHQGQFAAIKSFNNQYGYDKQWPVNGQYKSGFNTRYYQMGAGSGDDYPYRARRYDAETNPRGMHGQTINFGRDGKDTVYHRTGSFGDNYEEYKDNEIFHPYDAIGREQTRVAQQMARGNGKYVKGQGWQ